MMIVTVLYVSQHPYPPPPAAQSALAQNCQCEVDFKFKRLIVLQIALSHNPSPLTLSLCTLLSSFLSVQPHLNRFEFECHPKHCNLHWPVNKTRNPVSVACRGWKWATMVGKPIYKQSDRPLLRFSPQQVWNALPNKKHAICSVQHQKSKAN